MDPVSLGLGVVPAVMQAYGAVESAYDLYLSIKDFPDTYCNIRVALLIERYRLELFKDEVLSIPDEEIQRIQNSSRDLAFWKILSVIFQKILNTFNHSSEMMEQVGGKIGLPEQKGAAGGFTCASCNAITDFAQTGN